MGGIGVGRVECIKVGGIKGSRKKGDLAVKIRWEIVQISFFNPRQILYNRVRFSINDFSQVKNFPFLNLDARALVTLAHPF